MSAYTVERVPLSATFERGTEGLTSSLFKKNQEKSGKQKKFSKEFIMKGFGFVHLPELYFLSPTQRETSA